MLKEAGADEDVKNGCNQTPLELLKDIVIV